MKTSSILGVFLMCVSLNTIIAQPCKLTIVRYPSGLTDDDPRSNYDRSILTLLLEKTVGKYGAFELVDSVRMQQVRAIASIKSGEIDVMPSTYNLERDRQLLAVKHDIHRSLMGIRLLLVKRSKLPLFSKITAVEELKKLLAGQGADWPDVTVLRDNGFNVVTTQAYAGLFKMLTTERFDYFPRAITEIWDEVKLHSGDDLVVEPNLALVYYSPAFIFVNKKNTELAHRLDEGFKIALRDGSFNKLFMEKNSANFALSNLKNRRIFYLRNTTLPTAMQDKRPNINF
ncbi:MAG: transporter substrate-binding domain-containing protein [Chitinophagaceae bacterium]|nr:transporter substrate-binding domain-containing protein [Oligoflexus sp.]